MNGEEVDDADECVAEGIGESSANQFALGSKLFSVASIKDYTGITKLMIDDYGEKVHSNVKILYAIQKDRPKIVGGEIVPCRKIYDRVVYEPYAAKTYKEKYADNKIKFEKGKVFCCGHNVHFFCEK